jgi:hypothetical protein
MGTPNYENIVQYFPPNWIIRFLEVYDYLMYYLAILPSCNVVGWGTMLQARRLRVWFQMRSSVLNLHNSRTILVFVLSTAEPSRTLHSVTDSHSVIQSVSQSCWGSWPHIYYCFTVTILLLWDALSDERTGLSFVIVIVCSSKSFVIM